MTMGSKPIAVTRKAKDGKYRKFAYELTHDLNVVYLDEAADPRSQNDARPSAGPRPFIEIFVLRARSCWKPSQP